MAVLFNWVYQLVPLVMKMFHKSDLHRCVTTIVLIEDRIRDASKLRITAVQISVQNASDIQQGLCGRYSAVTQSEDAVAALDIIFSGFKSRQIRRVK